MVSFSFIVMLYYHHVLIERELSEAAEKDTESTTSLRKG